MLKPITFCGGALENLRQFPSEARREAGYQLSRVQSGLEPLDWKPMAGIGGGVRQIRIRCEERFSYRICRQICWYYFCAALFSEED